MHTGHPNLPLYPRPHRPLHPQYCVSNRQQRSRKKKDEEDVVPLLLLLPLPFDAKSAPPPQPGSQAAPQGLPGGAHWAAGFSLELWP